MTWVGMLDLRKDPRSIKKLYAYASVAKAEGIDFFYFSPGRVQLQDQTILGWFYENGQWIERKVPFPHVIINSKSQANNEQTQAIIEYLRDTIPFTSYPVGNKMKVYENLQNGKFFSPYLLPTQDILDNSIVFEFLQQFTRVIVKPRNGRKGNGVTYIEQITNDQFEIIESSTPVVLNKEQLHHYLRDLITDQSWIVQRYNPSKTKHGLSYDIRIHVQKNGEGKWIITTIYPRVGNYGAIKANISAGGFTNYLDPFLQQEFGEQSFDIRKMLERFGLSLALHMDEIYGVSYDELGIDVGLDENLRIWLYEINWHPGCPPTFYLELDVVRHSLQYAAFLAQQKKALLRSQDIDEHVIFQPLIIAITGSAGKSTAKEMVASILEQRWKIFKSEGNQNTTTYTELHAKQIHAGHRAAVLEYGMAYSGIIAKHCSILPPDLSVITNIGTAHVDNLGGRIEDVARTKSEIIKGMNPSGTLFLNADDENSKLLQTHDFKGKIVRVGTNNTADYIAYNIHYVENGMSFCVKISGEEQTFFIPIYGQHNVYNAMFAIAIAHMYGFSPDDMRKGLATYQRPNARLTIHQLDKGIQLIDDTCHANPEAMKVAIDVLAQIGKGQTIAVFERMSTRGNHAIEGYRQVGKHLAEQKIDYLFTLGKKAVYYGEGAIEAGYPTEKLFHFLDKDQMHQELLKHIEPGATVLIKGARERKMVETVEFLQKQYKK